MKTINVAVTGFYGTGSGAVIDLLREYEDVQTVPYTDINYEHVPFYISGGLFDLCSLLLNGNNPYSSDRVINNFNDAMAILNDNDFLWFGSYKKLFGNDFQRICNAFINEISYKKTGKNTNHIESSRYSVAKAFAQVCASLIMGKSFTQYGIHYNYDRNPVYFSMPDKDSLFKAARRFTSSYFSLFDKYTDSTVRVYDHLIWAQQIDTFEDCFDDSFKIIVVVRDPRDVYLSDQHVWSKPPVRFGKPHFPTRHDLFVKEWEQTILLDYSNPNVLLVHFEDLIYNYEDTVCVIEDFLDLSGKHVNPKKYFDPSRSIENTQLFLLNKRWNSEVGFIERDLKQYLYSFPYARKPYRARMFDR